MLDIPRFPLNEEQVRILEQEKPRALGFVAAGTPQVHFAPNSFFRDYVPAVENSALIRLGAHVTLKRLENLNGFEEEDPSGSQLELAVSDAEHHFYSLVRGVRTALKERTTFNGKLFDETKGLAVESMFFHLAQTAGLPLQISSLYEDRKGVDFTVPLADGDSLALDLASTSHKDAIAEKLKRDSLIIVVPFRGGSYYNGKSMINFTNALLTGQLNDLSSTREDIQYGRVEGFVTPPLPYPQRSDVWRKLTEQETARYHLESIVSFNELVTEDFTRYRVLNDEQAQRRRAGLDKLRKWVWR